MLDDTQTALLYPVFVQVALTFALWIWTGILRYGATASREVKLKDVALRQSVWSEQITKVGNCVQNQLESPILFYAVVALLLVSGMADKIQIGLAWAYVITRLVHAYIHTGSNYVPNRFMVFAAGLLVLAAMWVWFAIRVIV